VKGIEPSESQVKIINERFKRKVCENKNVDLDDIKGKYNLIYMADVLEHLVDPVSFLERLKKNLQGVIFIEVPNCRNKRINKASLSEQIHTYHFTKNSLRKLFENQGYSVLHIEEYENISKNLAVQMFKAIFRINNYEKKKKGEKLILIAKQ